MHFTDHSLCSLKEERGNLSVKTGIRITILKYTTQIEAKETAIIPYIRVSTVFTVS